ncbi:MAG TPA: hypothetical protein PK239_06295 [Chitinophagales bacterium]|nr:hypothetical protein [Chitinophagales bacterium]
MAVALRLKQERDKGLREAEEAATPDLQKQQKYQIQNRYFQKIEHLLEHATFGDRFLNEPACTQILKDVMHEYDGKYYNLLAFCIMPNHVHLLIDTSAQLPPGEQDFNLEEYQYIKDIMRRIKGKSGLLLNRERNTSGEIWFKESFDRYIRNDRHLRYTLNYILDNPVKAKLAQQWTDWSGTYLKPS